MSTANDNGVAPPRIRVFERTLLVIAGQRTDYPALFRNGSGGTQPALKITNEQTTKPSAKSKSQAGIATTSKETWCCVIRSKDGLSELRLRVEQAGWHELVLTSHGSSGGLCCTLLPGSSSSVMRHCVADFVLFRAGCRGGPNVDWRPKLDVIAHADPTVVVNSIESFLLSQDKAAMAGRLLRVKRRLRNQLLVLGKYVAPRDLRDVSVGTDRRIDADGAKAEAEAEAEFGTDADDGFSLFPLVDSSCYSEWRAATFPPPFPCVVKVGTASGGLGKARVKDQGAWTDMTSVLAMQADVFTTEPLVAWKYDIRIQKIGNHYRAFRRTSESWKSNTDINMKDEDCVVEPRWRVWIDEASYECGSDICAMDVLQTEDGTEYILELNSSAIGLNARHAEEDEGHIRDLMLRRIGERFEQERDIDRISADKLRAERERAATSADNDADADSDADAPVAAQKSRNAHAKAAAKAPSRRSNQKEKADATPVDREEHTMSLKKAEDGGGDNSVDDVAISIELHGDARSQTAPLRGRPSHRPQPTFEALQHQVVQLESELEQLRGSLRQQMTEGPAADSNSNPTSSLVDRLFSRRRV